MTRTFDLSWTVPQEDGPAANWDVPPYPIALHSADDSPTSLAPGAPATVLVGLDPQIQDPVPEPKLEITDKKPFQSEQSSDKLVCGHGFLPSHRFLLEP